MGHSGTQWFSQEDLRIGATISPSDKLCTALLSILVTLAFTLFIGIGAGLAGPVLAGPLFRQFNDIHYRYNNVICMCLLQPDHFKSPSHVPAIYQ